MSYGVGFGVDTPISGHYLMVGGDPGPESAGGATTPGSVPLAITGDIDIRLASAFGAWTTSSPSATVMYKLQVPGDASVPDWLLLVGSTAFLAFGWSPDAVATLTAISTVGMTITDGDYRIIRVTLDVDDGGGNNVVTFYSKAGNCLQAAADCASNTGWTQLGDSVTAVGATSVHGGTGGVVVGAPSSGKIYSLCVKSGIGGTTVTNPDFVNAVAMPVVENGNSWTLGGNAQLA